MRYRGLSPLILQPLCLLTTAPLPSPSLLPQFSSEIGAQTLPRVGFGQQVWEKNPFPAAKQRRGWKRLLALPSQPLSQPPQLPAALSNSVPALLHGGDRPTGCHSEFCGPCAPRPLPVGHQGVRSRHRHIFCTREANSALGGARRMLYPSRVCRAAHSGIFGRGMAGHRMFYVTSLGGRGTSSSQEPLSSLLSPQMPRWW